MDAAQRDELDEEVRLDRDLEAREELEREAAHVERLEQLAPTGPPNWTD